MCASALKYSLIICFCFPVLLKAQTNRMFVQELETVFQSLPAPERNSLKEETDKTWKSSFYTDADRDSVNALFGKLRELRATVNPELKNFVRCINAFRIRNEKVNSGIWMQGLRAKMAEAKRKKTLVKDYLVASAPFICEQTLFTASNHRWIVRGDYVWSFDSVVHISWKDAEVICKTPKDSTFIHSAAVSYMLGDNEFTGNGGVVKWGTGGAVLSADLSAFRIPMNVAEYTADSVLFHYDARYDHSIQGRLRDNASKYTRSDAKPFPEFTSYATDIKLDPVYDDVSFTGGISYANMKLYGFGTVESPALIRISPNDSISMNLYSRRFSIDSSRIVSAVTRLVVDLDSGQITHPDVNFVYLADKRTALIKRISEQSIYQPFRDDYHKLLFNMEQIEWHLDSTYLDMGMNSRAGLNKAIIESLNFFHDDVYDNLQGMDEMNPLNGLLICSQRLKSDIFAVSEYAEFIKKPLDALRKQIILLSYSDFVDYDEVNDEIKLKQRLFDYTRARVGKQDYDNIRFASFPKDQYVNARMDVRNYNLQVFGVDEVMISNSKRVYAQPSDKTVVILKNRDMNFSGLLKAGMFDMYGKNLYFSYDKYAIDLSKVDSTGMYLTEQNTERRGRKVKSQIREITGNLIIDKPGNKSGKKKEHDYPVLNSTKDSYVYFDDPDIRGGEYKRDSFYYVIKPYSIKGINNTANFRYAFDGTLVSNIVSPINDTLRLMADSTLGLVHKTPASGIGLYGKGTIKSRITLDKKGFMASGNVELNNSDFQSDSILMLPEKMNAGTKVLRVHPEAQRRPEAIGEQVSVTYLPRTGNLQAVSGNKPFEIYKSRVKHSGTLSIYEDLLDAAGKLELKDMIMVSDVFNLQAGNILSEHARLNISSSVKKSVYLNTADVRANIDLVNNKGSFKNNVAGNRLNFESNRYACSFSDLHWYMNDGLLNIGIEDAEELASIWKNENADAMPDAARNVFVSTDRNADSLAFTVPLSKYNLNSGEISCCWVNHIDIANGRFYPDGGSVAIDSTGSIKSFTNSRLLCERTDTSRMLEKVDFDIKGRLKFNGSGDLNYVNEDNESSVVRFSGIMPDTTGFICAKADIAGDKPLALNKGLLYKGNLILHSRQKELFYKGYIDLAADNRLLGHTWLAVNDYLDSRHISVPVRTENRDDKDQRIFNAVFLTMDKKTRPYASFQSNRLFYSDDVLIGGNGHLEWEKDGNKYVIRDTAVNKYYHYTYRPEDNAISAFGNVDLAMNVPGVYQRIVADVNYDLQKERLDITDAIYMVDFKLLPKLESIMLKDLMEQKQDSVTVDERLTEKLFTVYEKPQMLMVKKQLEKKGVPDSLNRLLVFDALDFEWKDATKSYIAKGKARLLASRGHSVGKEYDVAAELIRRRGGNQLYIYLKDDLSWYYFECSDANLYTLSSREEYNEALRREKADNKIIKNVQKETLYTITLCPDSKIDRFLKRVK